MIRRLGKSVVDGVSSVLIAVAVSLLLLWHRVISPVIGPRCRFYPTCSEYAVVALRKHRVCKGSWLSLKGACLDVTRFVREVLIRCRMFKVTRVS